MNQVAGIYPQTLTFARDEVRIKPLVTRWKLPDPAELAGLEVLELLGPEAWTLWDSVVSEQDKRNAR